MSDSGFSLDFIDDIVFDTLGDSVTVIPKRGESVVIKAPFYNVHDSKDLNARVDNNYPHLKDVRPEHLYLFKKGTLVKFNGNTYSYYKKNPNSANTWEIELRDEINTW